MNKIEKIKTLIEWILSLVFMLRLRKTYWSIAVPLALVILGEIANKLEFVVKATAELYEDANDTWLEIFWGALYLWVSINLPWWSILLIIMLLLLFTYVWLQEIKAKKSGIEVTVESITSNIFNRLSKDIDDKIEGIKSEMTFEPNQNWFKEQCKSSIDDLGKRYTPELNVKLKVSEIFEGLGRTEEFKRKVTKLFDQFMIKGKRVLKNQLEVKASLKTLENIFDALETLFHNTDFLGTTSIPVNEFEDLLNKAHSDVHQIYDYYITEERELQKERNEYQYYHKYGSELRSIREFEHELSTFQNLIHSSSFKLANNPFLFLDGEAGIGKSHLIGDVVTSRINKEHESVFLLGQYFTTKEDPWTQIFKRLQINSKAEHFLIKLNQRAEDTGKRIVIFIDAVNEGKGTYFWNDFIKSFINEIKKHVWLGLVLTIRTSYKSLILPEEERESLDIVEHHHYGFRGIEYEASKLFFNNYNIELPNVPLLHPEFQNPLFLKLFCEGISKAGLTRIPDGLQGITAIINFFIENVNRVLAKPNRVNYSNNLNLVQKAVYALIKYKVNNQLRNVSYESAYKIIDESISDFIDKKGLIDDLILEGVLWTDRFNDEIKVFFAYERLEDHLTVQYLFEQYSDLESEFKEGGELYDYVRDENAIYMNKGLIDALSIQVPERLGLEFSYLIPNHKDTYPIIQSFVESLLWRQIETINEESKNYVNRYVFSYQGTYDLFWETILATSGLPGHLFNAYSLHKYLNALSLGDRDASWTQFLKYRYDNDSSVKRLIDWSWSETDKSHISDESILLTSITLAWFHTSTNRELRDCSTKAMICLLQDRVQILIELLQKFETVNDPYVHERLFAVAYGCAIRANKKEGLEDLSDYIFQTIFKDKDEVYPHILLRDYARGVIEFTNFSGFDLKFDLKDVRPPYKSFLPNSFLTIDEIDDKYKVDYEATDYKKYYSSQNSIIRSMTTEYGRGTGGYGDFGRYTFQSALRSWEINTNNLSNLALEWIFEKYGYDVEKHGEYDYSITSHDRQQSTIERIGKKYQWIALFEIAARVADNHIKIKKYEDDVEGYQGPWDPHLRNIDPTTLIKTFPKSNSEELTNFWFHSDPDTFWEKEDEEWINDNSSFPEFEKLICSTDNAGGEWLILQNFEKHDEPKRIGEEEYSRQSKDLWFQIRSYLVLDSEYHQFCEWIENQDFMGRWMPENRESYGTFSREFYWALSQTSLKKQEDYDEWSDVYDRNTRRRVGSLHVTTQRYLWEEHLDLSLNESIRFLIPSQLIFDGMELYYGDRLGELVDSSNVVQCMYLQLSNYSDQIRIRKSSLLQFLENNSMKIIWTVLGEKKVSGGRTEELKRMEVSGGYFWNGQQIEGNNSFKRT